MVSGHSAQYLSTLSDVFDDIATVMASDSDSEIEIKKIHANMSSKVKKSYDRSACCQQITEGAV